MDGGSENANKFVLATLEALVAKRMSRVIYYTRLPKGHTHDDMDAIFGIIWKSRLHYDSAHTFNAWKKAVEETFTTERTTCEVMDMTMVVPDYSTFLEPFVDDKLSNLHKGETTQLQWRFEAVEISVGFP